MKKIYFDNGSTTQCYKEVVNVMNEVMADSYGNPSSNHLFGKHSRDILEKARVELSKEINSKPWEIVFTSGATESINLALKGLLGKWIKKIIISKIEHSAVYETCKELEKQGLIVKEVSVDKNGFLNLEELERETNRNALVSIIHGHNEVGVLQNLEMIGKICKKKGALLHIDAAQTYGKEKIDVKKIGIDLLTASAHKMHGPKGIGFLFVREGLKLKAIIDGAGQERNNRSGTENVPGILGFSKALELIKKADKERIRKLRDHFIVELEKLGGKINGSREMRLYNNIHVSFPIDAELLVTYLSEKGIFCSTRSACTSLGREKDRTLSAIGLNDEEIKGSFRIVLSQFNSKSEIDLALKEIEKGIGIQAQ